MECHHSLFLSSILSHMSTRQKPSKDNSVNNDTEKNPPNTAALGPIYTDQNKETGPPKQQS